MDKQKLEEIVKLDIEKSVSGYSAFINDLRISKSKPLSVSKTIMSFDCPKKYILSAIGIHEGAVVLTSNQKISLEHEWYRLGYEQALNEIVDKFVEMAKLKSRHAFVNVDDNPREDRFLYLTDIDEIAKEIKEGL